MRIINQKLQLIIGNSRNAYDFSELSYSLSVSYKAGEPGTCSGSVYLMSSDKRQTLVNAKDAACVIRAGYDGFKGEVFKGVRKNAGITEINDPGKPGISLNLITSPRILTTTNAKSNGGQTVYSFVKRFCSDNGYQLAVFEGDKRATIGRSFSVAGNFYKILGSMAVLADCMVVFSGFEVKFLSFAKRANTVVEISSRSNSILKTGQNYDEEKGITYFVETILLYNIRVGSYVSVKTYDRESKKERRQTMRVSEVTHELNSDAMFKTRMSGYYV